MKSYEIDITLGIDAMHEESAVNKVRSFLSALELKKNEKVYLIGPEDEELEDSLIDVEDIDFDGDDEEPQLPELSLGSIEDGEDWDDDDDWDELVGTDKAPEPPKEAVKVEEVVKETAPATETS